MKTPIYTLNRKCLICSKEFLIDHPRRSYCSTKCHKEQFRLWDKERAKGKNLRSKAKSWEKKKELLLTLGGQCASCGNPDLRVMEFSHLDSSEKHLRLRKREKLNPMTRWNLMESEIKLKRVILECANCHRIRTHTERWGNNSIK